jgi:copper chaperone NosL
MKNNQISGLIRVIMMFCSAGLAVVLFVPLWRIELDAPQYPEGLSLLIFPDKLGGNVDIVNGLNHYIGMKTLHASDFIEFTVLPYIIGLFSALALLVAISAKPKLLNLFLLLFICFGVLAMVDFWRWEYNYGHDLNPEAAIVVPGMTYQPPLIGFKQLLNFGAYSIPDTGGMIFIAVGLAAVFCWWTQFNKNRKKRNNSIAVPVILFAIITIAESCSSKPEALKLGKDNCYFCKMTISDERFGAEIITKKGRIYKFDDSYCLLAYNKTNDLIPSEIKATYVTNFTGNHQLININEALLLQSNLLRGPMGGNLAAFTEADSLKKIQEQFAGKIINWKEISK